MTVLGGVILSRGHSKGKDGNILFDRSEDHQKDQCGYHRLSEGVSHRRFEIKSK